MANLKLASTYCAADYDRSLRVLRGLESSEARAVRGRALWYKGDLPRAADELGALLQDPEVKDPWAVEIVKLANPRIRRREQKAAEAERKTA